MQKPVQVNINLLPREPVNRRHWYYWGLSFALMAILGGLTAYYDVSRDRELNHLQVVNTDLKDQINKYKREAAQTIPLKEMKELINKKSQEMELMKKSQQSFVEVWGNVDKVVPSPILVTGMEINAKKIIITGFSPDHEQIAVLLQNLELNPYLENVDALSSKLNEKSNEVSFGMEMTWEVGEY